MKPIFENAKLSGSIDTAYGRMSTDFSEHVLGDLCESRNGVQTGPFGSQLHKKDYVEVGTPIITVEHLGDNRIIHRNLPRVSDNDKERLNKYVLREGDIVFSRVGSVDRRSLVRSEEDGWLFSGRCLRVRPDPNRIDSVYLSYFLGHPAFKEHIRSIAVGATMPSINTKILKDVMVYIPSLSEQRRIAHILGTLDDKIELNRRMNGTLEEMARAIFKDWFVDFGPVRAKMEGRDAYLPEEIWRLFPDRLVESELGEVPEGWGIRAFETLLDDVIGGDWGKETPDESHTEPVSIIRGTDFPAISNGGVGSVPLRFTTKKKAERRMLKDGDIIIEVSGGSPTQSTGRSLAITRDVLRRFPRIMVCASFCRRFRPNSWRDGLFASRHLDFLHSTGKMWDYQLQSTGIANFQTTRFLKEEMVVWPGEKFLTRFADTLNAIIRQTARNESMTLVSQRDALLPVLISGEVGVQDAGKVVKQE